ncbi:hypothetical protein EOW77_0010775 [Bradyrhizobium yuanmingense]|nr:hypothetical protein EOW77_0010775 [Bradyrhizobium yuanmingense]
MMTGAATTHLVVMPGLDPGIHVFLRTRKCVDGRVKPGHDGRESVCLTTPLHSRTQSSTPAASSRPGSTCA